MVIRDARPGDCEAIADFNIAMAFETEHLALDRARVTEGVRAVLSDATKGRYIVAEIDGCVAGQLMVTYEWSDWRNGMFWWIQSVYVDNAYRGRKIFSALYAHAKREAIAQGSCGLRLYVEEENKVAQRTYSKLGMTLTPYEMMEDDFVIKRG
ncbi:MAG TPA: GNAT family N-acetyltransferase [Bacteroidota bacterium]|nr:GNAT family N-acetyltransferase [Bacteroidota bacterium]